MSSPDVWMDVKPTHTKTPLAVCRNPEQTPSSAGQKPEAGESWDPESASGGWGHLEGAGRAPRRRRGRAEVGRGAHVGVATFPKLKSRNVTQ